MPRFDQKLLIAIVENPKILAQFDLMEREVYVLRMHLLGDTPFKIIGKFMHRSGQRAHQLYQRAQKKIHNQVLQRLGG